MFGHKLVTFCDNVMEVYNGINFTTPEPNMFAPSLMFGSI
jgi:hypothetical protein